MVQRKNKQKGGLARPVTMADLGKFTEEVILPSVESIVEEAVAPLREDIGGLREDIKAGFAEMREGFKDVHGSIRVLSGEIIELKVKNEDQKHEERLRRLEDKVGIRPRP